MAARLNSKVNQLKRDTALMIRHAKLKYADSKQRIGVELQNIYVSRGLTNSRKTDAAGSLPKTMYNQLMKSQELKLRASFLTRRFWLFASSARSSDFSENSQPAFSLRARSRR